MLIPVRVGCRMWLFHPDKFSARILDQGSCFLFRRDFAPDILYRPALGDHVDRLVPGWLASPSPLRPHNGAHVVHEQLPLADEEGVHPVDGEVCTSSRYGAPE